MNKVAQLPLKFLLASVLAGMVVFWGTEGCSSSSSSQGGATALPDSTSYQSQLTPSQKSGRNQRSSSAGNQQGFVTQEDTIEAEVVTHGQSANHTKPPSRGSTKKKYYSVQVGAFKVLSNADRSKKSAQQRYKKPVYQFFDKPIKMYRVTIGNFARLNEALKFLKSIQKDRPKEYKDAWVAEMRR
ncbi:MAG TPA: SPOR domain-containing protein [Bacteroidota bacterium]|nr:SPOR domain-containing protein [Bacteroidota bacterium]